MARYRVLFSVTDHEGEHGPGSIIEVRPEQVEHWIKWGVIEPEPIEDEPDNGEDATAQDAPGQPQNEPADAPATNKKKPKP